jgi:glycosyltransferase involved in cell wall biosynthesis
MGKAPLRVLHVVKSLGLGGTEKAMQLLVTGLNNTFFEACVFSLNDGMRRQLLEKQGVPVFVGYDLYKLLLHIQPDIVHLHRSGGPEPSLTRPPLLAEVPAIVETNVFGRLDSTRWGRSVDRILFVSNYCRDRYLGVHAIAADKRYDVIYNPVDTGIYTNVIPNFEGFPIVGRVSRADRGKWSEMSMHMLQRLVSKVPDVKYRVIGAIPEFHDYLRNKGLEHYVEFCDAVWEDEELADFYSGIGVLAHGSDRGESFGMVIAEAMAAGLPVVTHPAEGLRDNAQLELVEHGRTGFITNTADDYADALAYLLRHPEKARQMGAAGRRKVLENYASDVLVRRLEDIYLDVIGETKQHATLRHSRFRAPLPRLHQGDPQLPLCRSGRSAAAAAGPGDQSPLTGGLEGLENVA